jgi:hypothetical protein
MKTRFFTILLISLGLVLSVNAQEEKKGGMKVSSVGFSFGFAGAGTANTNEEFINLKNATNNPDLFIDPDEYNVSQYNFGFGGNVSPKVYLGLTPYSKKKGEYNYNQELRFSIGTGAGIRRMFNYYRYDNFRIDTLQSINNDNQVYADSSIYDRYIYQETFNEFNFGVSYLWKTPFERRFQFQAGAGLEYAYAFRSYVRVENLNEKKVYYYDPNDPPVFDEPDYVWANYGDDDFEGTTTTQNTNLSGSMHFVRATIPLGVNFRIARKEQSFFNKAYLWAEMNPGVEWQMVANDKTYVNPYFGIAWIGFTYRW